MIAKKILLAVVFGISLLPCSYAMQSEEGSKEEVLLEKEIGFYITLVSALDESNCDNETEVNIEKDIDNSALSINKRLKDLRVYLLVSRDYDDYKFVSKKQIIILENYLEDGKVEEFYCWTDKKILILGFDKEEFNEILNEVFEIEEAANESVNEEEVRPQTPPTPEVENIEEDTKEVPVVTRRGLLRRAMSWGWNRLPRFRRAARA